MTGKPQPIGLGWLDDSMKITGPTEEDKNYIADTGASPAEMQAQVDAYQDTIQKLREKLIPLGGFYWQLMDSRGAELNQDINKTMDAATCKSFLQARCVANSSAWKKFQLYNIPHGGTGVTAQGFTDYTAEFLLTRGPYAILGYSWCGCTNGAQERPRAAEWDEDFGEPVDEHCVASDAASGVYKREYSKATVTWDCNAGHGKIVRQQ